ncbi:hypothetical protein Tco_0410785 [Tanacetum coccineum]
MLSGFFQNQSQPSTSTSMVPTNLPIIQHENQTQRGELEPLRLEDGLSTHQVHQFHHLSYDVNEPLTEKGNRVYHGLRCYGTPSTKNIQPPVIQKSQDPVIQSQVDNSPLSKEPFKETKLPYPSRVEREKKDSNDKVQIQKFWEMFKKIHVDITLQML